MFIFLLSPQDAPVPHPDIRSNPQKSGHGTALANNSPLFMLMPLPRVCGRTVAREKAGMWNDKPGNLYV
jgi:hypothetical protein